MNGIMIKNTDGEFVYVILDKINYLKDVGMDGQIHMNNGEVIFLTTSIVDFLDNVNDAKF